jgi:hypothetical protein
MPASSESVALTDHYRDELATERGAALAVIASSWALLEREDLDHSYALWMATAAAMIAEKQRSGISAAEAYLATFIASEFARRFVPLRESADTSGLIGFDRFGRPLLEALRPPLFTVKAAITGGIAFDVALRLGRNRALRIGAESMANAPREALHRLHERSSSVAGWRRVPVGPTSCGACLADADGSVHRERDRLKIHAACDCVAEPVIIGVRERFVRPTGEQIFRDMTPDQQAELFQGRGGAEKAKVLRNGDAPFSSLISPDRRVLGPDGITETPLASLT